MPRRCLVLYSGGLDSTTIVAIARSEGRETVALTFRYGQRHSIEVERSQAEALRLGMEQHVVEIDLRSLGGSALTADGIDVPRDRTWEEIRREKIPPTYVPGRNTIFLSYALAWSEVLGISDVFIGVNALDYSGYPDCRPAFIEAFERLANLATRSATEGGTRFRIHAPLAGKTKAEIIRWGIALGVDYTRTWSCYAPVAKGAEVVVACGRCDSCLLRKKGFLEAGVRDPTPYESVVEERGAGSGGSSGA